ncbi:MAG TPA: FtsX-like permease family protein [Thermoanaerobaculia bacterium]|jgi:lipoprotein-releasing system permease protein
MRFESFVALRYLAASRRRAHVALIAKISIFGLALGVAALIISLALLEGFQDRIRLQMISRAHLRITPARGARIADPDRVRTALASVPGVGAVTPVIEGRGWASDAAGTAAMPVRYRNAPGLSDVLGPVARVNAAASVRLHSGEGQTIRLTSSRIRLSPIGPIPVTVDLRVAKVQFTGPLDKTPEIEVSEATARTLTGDLSGVDAFEARVADPGRTEELAGAVRASLGADYRVQTWRELNAPLAFALRLEKAVIFVTVALVILVAALNIVSNIALTVVEKKRDLGVFTAMGSPPVSIERIYLTLGAVIGVIGTATGVVFGVGLSLLLDRYPLVKLPDVYLISRVPFSVYPGEVAGVAAFALLTAIGAALLPARAAARLAPGEAIRLSR